MGMLSVIGEPSAVLTGGDGAATKPPSAAATQAPAAKPQEKPSELVAFEAGREVMEILRSSHSHVCSILEVMCTDIGEMYTPAT